MQAIFKQRVAVLGLGHFGGGIAVSRWLVQQGATVLVADQSSRENLTQPVKQLADLPIEFRFGPEQREEDFTQADLVVASPAVPPDNRFLKAARAAGVPITTEICLFAQRCKAPVIGVTGTKGKSTTSTLLHRMICAGLPNRGNQTAVWFGGNIGKSLLADLPDIQPEHLVVLELSSYMLEHLGQMRWSPHVAVVTMVSADHLDWHGSEPAYIDAKRNIVRFQNPGDFAVLNSENATARSFEQATPAKVIEYTAATHRRFNLKLSGEHNQLNAQAAFAAASIFGVDWATAQAAIADFKGLPHRLELIHEAAGIQFINDSISTIPEAAIAAVNSFPAGRVIQIVGGSAKKDLPIDNLCTALSQKAKAVLCIGETAGKVMEKLTAGIAYRCDTLEIAIALAKTIAVTGDIILLSPGHPSYDQFTNFEARGSQFTQLCR